MTSAIRAAVVCGAVVLGVAGAAVAAQPNIKDGLWEITMKMEMDGMPGGGRPPQTMQHCITPKDVEDPARLGRGMDRDNNCKVTDFKHQGNTASWKMKCTGENAMTGTGAATYSGTAYSTTTKMAMTRGGQTMNMTMAQTGKYLGPCKK